ncbi:MAG: TonB-dependent receptor [Candidatus Marinimicrobia bacterium]|nr:TonB-dependent receptor [Candidatus Neomarinimicrobiota bacterium]
MLFSILFLNQILYSQTAGKISGRVVDVKSKLALPGANIILLPVQSGISADEEGFFNLINVSPGNYTVKVMMIGYETVVIENVIVSVNRTTSLDIIMNQTSIEGKEVVIYASKFSRKKDQTSTVKNISSEEIDILPVEDLGAVVNMQAGVVAGHFRGGRSDEVSYLIDGVAVNDVFGGVVSVSNLEVDAVKDLEVITGTFNAEYGNAMSGVVNAVTKDGNNRFEASINSGLSSYLTENKRNGEKVYIGLDPFGINTNTDLKFNISGPVIKDKIFFFTNYRSQEVNGHLNGIRRFNVWDLSDFYDQDSSKWYSENTGDSVYVPMNTGEYESLMGKISFNFGNIKFSIMQNHNNSVSMGYSHVSKYNPDGRSFGESNTGLTMFQFNHFLNDKMFYDIKYSTTVNKYGSYVFKDYDSFTIASEAGIYQGLFYFTGDTIYNYVHDKYQTAYGTGFFTGGQDKGHTHRRTITRNFRTDFVWQLNNAHSIKTGFSLSNYELMNKYHTIRNAYAGTALESDHYKPIILPDSTTYADVYTVYPKENAFYIQDKFEWDEFVVNIGLRYDYFDANTTFPSQRRNPVNASTYYLKSFSGDDSLDQSGNLIIDVTRMSTLVKSKIASQISPRFGFACQLGGIAVLHFSYGHFLQMPPMYSIYSNHSSIIGPSDYSTTVGNANLGSDSLGLNAQKTVSYEIGLWQEVGKNLGLEVSLYYRDIYELLSLSTVSTYNQIEYGIYTNKDYGNVRGLELKLDYSRNNLFLQSNYTYQFTRGNADNPAQTFNRQGASIDKVIRFIPMSWDQRHTFNISFGYNTSIFGVTATGYYNSSTPYTFSPQGESNLALLNLYPNNDYKPSNYHADMSGYIYLPTMFGVTPKLEFIMYNVTDRYNEYRVSSETGRSYTAVVTETELLSHRSNFNTYEDRYKDPSMFSAPRQIKLGLTIAF